MKPENKSIGNLSQEIACDKLNLDAPYQRSDQAWSKKLQSALIDSLMNDYYIPPILIANNEVIDGKQRLTAVLEFMKGSFDWVSPNGPRNWKKDFSPDDKEEFMRKTLIVHDLGKMSDGKIIETFIRINKNTIKLNKTELLMATANEDNKELLHSLSNSDNVQKISNRKKTDKRFTVIGLLARCITITELKLGSKNSARNKIEKVLKEKLIDFDQKKEDFQRTLDTMYKIFGNDSIPPKCFNVVFEALFVSIYKHIESRYSYIHYKDLIKSKLDNFIKYVTDNQMGGGIYFDSMEYITERIREADKIFEPFNLDKRRAYTYDEKVQLWKTSPHKCEICGKPITDINDYEPDHINPHVLGGKTDLKTNARILCRKCNRSEGAKIKKQF